MNVAVLFGGASCEHDISIITASAFFATKFEGKRVRRIYIDQSNRWWLVKGTVTPSEIKRKPAKGRLVPITLLPGDNRVFGKFCCGRLLVPLFRLDCAVLCFHGLNGEDGSVQGLLQLCGIAYSGSGVAACSLGLNKTLMKDFFVGIGLPVLPFVTAYSDKFNRSAVEAKDPSALDLLKQINTRLHYPLIVKPNCLGSSIGVSTAKNQEELFDALELAYSFDFQAVIEPALTSFYEINCSALVIEGRHYASRLERPLSKGEILSFADKYIGDASFFPKSEIKKADCPFEKEIKQTTVSIANNLNCGGVVRVDYLVTDKEFFVNEINILPGNLSYHLWQDRFGKDDFVRALVFDALRVDKTRKSLSYSYASQVLDGCSMKK